MSLLKDKILYEKIAWFQLFIRNCIKTKISHLTGSFATPVHLASCKSN